MIDCGKSFPCKFPPIQPLLLDRYSNGLDNVFERRDLADFLHKLKSVNEDIVVRWIREVSGIDVGTGGSGGRRDVDASASERVRIRCHNCRITFRRVGSHSGNGEVSAKG